MVNNNEILPPGILSREIAQSLVDDYTYKIQQYSAVSRVMAFKLLNRSILHSGEDRYALLLLDPIRNNGPTKDSLYPWNVVDYLSNENPRGK